MDIEKYIKEYNGPALKVLILTHVPLYNACFKLRLGFFLDKLIEEDVVFCYWVNDFSKAQDADIIIVQRYFQLSPTVKKILSTYKKTIIFETDDMLPLIPDHHHDVNDRVLYTEFYKFIGQHADIIHTTTPLIAQELTQYTSENKIKIIKNTLPVEYEVKKRKKGPINLAFVGGSSHNKDLEIVEPVLLELQKRYKNKINFHCFGYASRTIQKTLKNFQHRPFEQDYLVYLKTLNELNIDIGISPLVSDRFNKTKSNIKFLEYAFTGVVGVFSPVGAYADNPLICETPQKWFDTLSYLIENPQSFVGYQEQAINIVKAKYDFFEECDKFQQSLFEKKQNIFIAPVSQKNIDLDINALRRYKLTNKPEKTYTNSTLYLDIHNLQKGADE